MEIRDLNEARKQDAAVWDRMEALVREVARMPIGPGGYALLPSGIGEAARAIVALLPKPVDPDEVIARQMVLDEDIERTGRQRQSIADGAAGQRKVALVLAAIKRGRELAARDA